MLKETGDQHQHQHQHHGQSQQETTQQHQTNTNTNTEKPNTKSPKQQQQKQQQGLPPRAHLVNLCVELLVHNVVRHRGAHDDLPEDLSAEVAVHQARAREACLKRFLGESVVKRLLVVVEPATSRK